MTLPDAPIAEEGFSVTHFLTVANQARSIEFYVGVLGGKTVKEADPSYAKLANSWIILNSGGGPTPDKPEVILETPPNLNRGEQLLESSSGGHLGLLLRMEGKGRRVLDGAARQPRRGIALLHARSRWLHY